MEIQRHYECDASPVRIYVAKPTRIDAMGKECLDGD
jgi:hypothetical protein